LSRLNLTNITDREALEHRIKQLSTINMADKKIIICRITPTGKQIYYTLEEALAGLQRYAKGLPDEIGEFELLVAKKELAYDRMRGSKTGLE